MMLAVAPIRTTRLTLRLPVEADFEAVAAFGASPRARFVGGASDGRLEAWRVLMAGIGHWAIRGYGYWTVEETATGALAGRIGVIRYFNQTEPELAWHLFDGFEGKGFATEAAAAARADYHARISPAPLYSWIHPDNTRSVAVARRLGARIESRTDHDGEPVDVWRHPGPGTQGRHEEQA